jgi:hypothetical protein
MWDGVATDARIACEQRSSGNLVAEGLLPARGRLKEAAIGLVAIFTGAKILAPTSS